MSFVLTLACTCLLEYCYILKIENYCLKMAVRLTRFLSCDPFKTLCWVASAPHQNFFLFFLFLLHQVCLYYRYTHTHTHTHTQTHTKTHTHKCAHTHARARIHTHIHTHTRVHALTHSHSHSHSHTHTYTHAYTHIHTHTPSSV